MSVTRALRDAHKCKCSEGQAVSLYRIKVIRSLDRDTAELYYVQTDELIARGTRKKSNRCWRVSYAKQPRKERMADNPTWEICERVAEVQALLDDHLAGGKHTAADVVAKTQAVLSESALLRAMFDIAYFPCG